MFKDKLDRVLRSTYKQRGDDISGLREDDIPSLDEVLNKFENNIKNEEIIKHKKNNRRRIAVAAAIAAVVPLSLFTNYYNGTGENIISLNNVTSIKQANNKLKQIEDDKKNNKSISLRNKLNQTVSQEEMVNGNEFAIKDNKENTKLNNKDKDIINKDNNLKVVENNKEVKQHTQLKESTENNKQLVASVSRLNEKQNKRLNSEVKNSKSNKNVKSNEKEIKNIKDINKQNMVAINEKGNEKVKETKEQDKDKDSNILNKIPNIYSIKSIISNNTRDNDKNTTDKDLLEKSNDCNKTQKPYEVIAKGSSESIINSSEDKINKDKVETEKIGNKVVSLVYEDGVLKEATWNSGKQKFTMILRQYMTKDEVLQLIKAYR